MTRLDDAQLARLPKWARRHVEGLYAEADYRQSEREAMFDADPAEVEVSLSYFTAAEGNKHDHQPLKSQQGVRFNFPTMPGNPHMDVRLDPVRGGISITGSEPVSVVPQSSNLINVGVRPRG